MVKLKPNDPNTLSEYASLKLDVEFDGASMMEGFDGSEIEKILLRIVSLTGDTLDSPHIRLGDLCYKTMRFKEAVTHYQRALVLRQTRPGDQSVTQDDLLLRFSRSWYRIGDRNNAIAYAAQASLENMNNVSALDFLNFLRGRVRVD
jgi:tetratricopeptide (TPR) repeat protein